MTVEEIKKMFVVGINYHFKGRITIWTVDQIVDNGVVSVINLNTVKGAHKHIDSWEELKDCVIVN